MSLIYYSYQRKSYPSNAIKRKHGKKISSSTNITKTRNVSKLHNYNMYILVSTHNDAPKYQVWASGNTRQSMTSAASNLMTSTLVWEIAVVVSKAG